MGVALGQLLLSSGGDQDVAVGLQDVSRVRRGVWEANDGPVGLETETENDQKPPDGSTEPPRLEIRLWDQQVVQFYSFFRVHVRVCSVI